MIIVTGASQGLGYAISKRLTDKEVDVIGISRNVDDLPFKAISCDVTSYRQLKSLSSKLKLEGASVSGLINCAGIASMNLALATPEAITEKIVKTNLLGTIFSCQCLAPLLIRNGCGSIINFSTIAVHLGLKGESVYAASKGGVESFSRVLAGELSSFGIAVNCIAPGPIPTNLLKGVSQSQIEKIISQQIIRKQFSADDVCDLVEILLDNRSRSLTGQVLHVGGV